jgi:hypothetical protein
LLLECFEQSKACELGVRVIDEAEFMRILGGA